MFCVDEIEGTTARRNSGEIINGSVSLHLSVKRRNPPVVIKIMDFVSGKLFGKGNSPASFFARF